MKSAINYLNQSQVNSAAITYAYIMSKGQSNMEIKDFLFGYFVEYRKVKPSVTQEKEILNLAIEIVGQFGNKKA